MGSAGLGAFRRGEGTDDRPPFRYALIGRLIRRQLFGKRWPRHRICSPEMPYNSRLTTGNCPINGSLPDSSNH
jgi:hypothetical protein